MNDADTTLIKQLKAREESAFVFLFKEYYQRLYLYAANYLRDGEAAHDIVQGLFSDLYEKKWNVEITVSVKSYLFTATRNRCLNFLREMKIKDSHVQGMLEAHLYSDTVDAIEDQGLMDVIQAVVNSMPPGCREVFRLRVLKEYKFKEIAEELGISENSAKVQMNNALRIVRERVPYIKNDLILFVIGWACL